MCHKSKIKSVKSRKNDNVKVNKFFMSMVLYVDDPKVVGLIYKNGKIVLLGAKSVEDVDRGSKAIASKLDREIIESPVTSNWAGSFSFGSPINLNKYSKYIREWLGKYSVCSYEPELFPALIYHPTEENKIKCTMLFSGKVNITGCKTIKQVIDTHDDLTSLILTLVLLKE